MIIFTPNPHALRITPSVTELGRFDWAIWKDGTIVQQSIQSFGSEEASKAAGETAFQSMTAIWQNVRSNRTYQ